MGSLTLVTLYNHGYSRSFTAIGEHNSLWTGETIQATAWIRPPTAEQHVRHVRHGRLNALSGLYCSNPNKRRSYGLPESEYTGIGDFPTEYDA